MGRGETLEETLGQVCGSLSAGGSAVAAVLSRFYYAVSADGSAGIVVGAPARFACYVTPASTFPWEWFDFHSGLIGSAAGLGAGTHAAGIR